MKIDFVVVGAGLAGCTLAERLAEGMNKKVLLVEQRNHVGGNTYDYYNDDGILVQKYGPHIFHTSIKEVWEYLSKFTAWNDYAHRVIASVRGMQVYLPINLETMEKICGRPFTGDELKAYFEEKRLKLLEVKNSRDCVVSQVGEEIYDLFFKNYTKKQWGVWPEELDAQVTKRLPVRFDRDTRYFSDPWQGIPKYGFTRMFDKMLSSKNIHILLNTDYKQILPQIDYSTLIYTGPIDYFFNYKHGKLPYRSLEFRFKTLDREKFQDGSVVNYPNEHDYTRITEFKHFYFQKHHKTTIAYEYPKSEGDPYYPIPNEDCHQIYLKYKADAEQLKNVRFIGRLAEYRYINMDQVTSSALSLAKELTHGE